MKSRLQNWKANHICSPSSNNKMPHENSSWLKIRHGKCSFLSPFLTIPFIRRSRFVHFIQKYFSRLSNFSRRVWAAVCCYFLLCVHVDDLKSSTYECSHQSSSWHEMINRLLTSSPRVMVNMDEIESNNNGNIFWYSLRSKISFQTFFSRILWMKIMK